MGGGSLSSPSHGPAAGRGWREATVPEGERKALAVRALRGSQAITALACELGVSCKFVYVQTRRANAALDEAFPMAANDVEKLLVELGIAQRVVDPMVLALVRILVRILKRICRGSYRGAIKC